jgi:hypothetical protein
MKRIGMITVGRWMAEKLPNTMRAYMEHKGKLFRLKRIRCYNGHIRPIFETPWYRVPGFPYGEMQLGQQYTPESPVFLSMGENLVGLALADVIEFVTEAQDRCWALSEGDGLVATSGTAAVRAACAPQGVGQSDGAWYG